MLKPAPSDSSNRLKPMLAPATKGRVRKNPWLIPLLNVSKFTGPGEIDILRAKEHIAKINDIHFLKLVSKPKYKING
jgi:hypothetical protein